MSKIELRVVSGNQTGSLIPLAEGRFLIGREHDCHLRPNSELISRHHCAFTLDSHSLRIRDLGSTNGTFVNGERLQGTVQLKPGDLVRAGKVELMVVIDGRPSADMHDTMIAQGGDTLIMGQSVESKSAGLDSVVDIEDMAAELAMLEDESTATIESPTEVAPPGTVEVLSPAATSTMPETQAMPTFDPAAAAAAAAGQQAPYGFNPWGPPPGYPYPGGYPQYPPMPYGYGYPYPGQPMMPPGQMPPGYGVPPQPQAPAEETPPERPSGMPEIRLPDPSETGVKPPEPKPAAAGQTGDGKSKDHIPTAAQDIIHSYLNRRPKT